MNADGLETTLYRALEKTRADGLNWEKGGGKNRYVVDVGKFRLRIESVRAKGEHPFKFSITIPSGGGEIDEIRSAEANTPLSDDKMQFNQALRELWELASRKAGAGTHVVEVNQLLDAISSQDSG